MKDNLPQLLLFGILLFSVFLLANSSFPPPSSTGAPGEGLCSDCHGGSNPLNLNGDISINGIPNNPIEGERYQLEVKLRNPNGLASRGGFQMVVVDGENNNLGTLENPSNNSRTSAFGGKMYFEHNPARNFPANNEIAWTVDWIAPNNPSNRELKIFAAGNIADGNNNSSNDFIVTTVFEGTLELPSGTAGLSIESIEIFPNPTSDYLHFSGIEPGTSLRFQIVDGMGRLIHHGEFEVDHPLPVGHLQSGTYYITFAHEKGIWSKTFVKK